MYISIHFSGYKDSYNYFKLIRNYKEILWGVGVDFYLRFLQRWELQLLSCGM